MSALDATAARSLLVDDLARFLVGPVEDAETIPERALDRYHTGYLSPTGTYASPEEDDAPDGGDDFQGDDTLVLANIGRQGAMGLTFQVSPGRPLEVVAAWADYTAETGKDGKPSWTRMPREMRMPFEPQVKPESTVLGERDGVEVQARVRNRGVALSVTVTLVNRRADPPASDRATTDPHAYQARLEIRASDGAAVFLPRRPEGAGTDPEFWNHELLYGHVRSFAVGHGCSVGWETADGADERASVLFTRWIPSFEVRKASADVMKGDPALHLELLADPSRRDTTCETLERIPEAYEEWIRGLTDGLPEKVATYPADHQRQIRDAAVRNIGSCADAARRMRSGIRFLREDDVAWSAFCLTNRAMALAMRQARIDEPRWRAFQLAFLVLAIESTALPTHPDRGILDLIWFPTGGGKTEAYLGLAAFSMFYRRLSDPGRPPGTSVFSRYTLRLLTVQQFERAARLVCACEILRQAGYVPGDVPFSAGLFVGEGATPNTMDEAERVIRSRDPVESGTSTLPLRECPWCGGDIDTHQEIQDGHLLTRCADASCRFSSGLPLVVVDEELYAHPASIVVATVDKFARMAWEPRIAKLFGAGSGAPAPDLVIQDELHLINDALGTMVALYETAIDHLCSGGGGRPKVVGSTATIRRADRQAQGVFDRKVAVFPPSGLRGDDSFFYREDLEHPGRLYVGVHAQGRSPKHTLARVLGTLAQSSVQIDDPKVRDPFHTIVAYFNSLRELGGALVLAEDDAQRYIDSMPVETPPRHLRNIEELTSHLPSHRIPETFERLSTAILGASGREQLDREALDLVLATNMISVGIDVDRLGLMVVHGQPKTTAEYIQASSRIGRPPESAGLVVTIYNWTRPRDRSHYERFVDYHSAFYRHVEATSVTPFAARARDRALHAVLVALARLGPPDLAADDSAALVRDGEIRDQVVRLAEVIADRARKVDPAEADATRAQLDRLIHAWEAEAEDGTLSFQGRPGRMRSLLRSPERNGDRGLWPTPQSMRDVDPPSPVSLLRSSEIREIRDRRRQ